MDIWLKQKRTLLFSQNKSTICTVGLWQIKLFGLYSTDVTRGKRGNMNSESEIKSNTANVYTSSVLTQ